MPPTSGKYVQQQKFSLIAGENAKYTTTLEDSLAISYKTKHTKHTLPK